MTELFSHACTRQRSGALLLSAGIAAILLVVTGMRIRDLMNSPAVPARVAVVSSPSQPAPRPAEIDWPKSVQDLWLPFIGKIAKERQLEVTRVEVGPAVSTSTADVRKTSLNLLVKGEYADIKMLVIAMQDRFHGMTLSKFSVRRKSELPTGAGTGAPGASATPTTLEAGIEMTQFARQGSDELH